MYICTLFKCSVTCTVRVYIIIFHRIVCLLVELQALAQIIGPYGIQYLGERIMEQVSAQVKEIRKLVELNQDTLLALHTNRDKPDVFNELMRRLKSITCNMQYTVTLVLTCTHGTYSIYAHNITQ